MSKNELVTITKEDYFTFLDAQTLGETHCTLCGGKIPKRGHYKTNAAPKRLSDLMVCLACFGTPNFKVYINEKFDRILRSIEGLSKTLDEGTMVIAYIQNCDEEPIRQIKEKIHYLARKASFGIGYISSEGWSTEGRYAIPGIEFRVENKADFLKKWHFIVDNLRTDCGCSLMYGDGGSAEAYIARKNGHREQINFELL